MVSYSEECSAIRTCRVLPKLAGVSTHRRLRMYQSILHSRDSIGDIRTAQSPTGHCLAWNKNLGAVIQKKGDKMSHNYATVLTYQNLV